MLEAVKLALRIKTKAFDDEITALCSACIMDMKRVGIVYNADNALCKQAVILYCKANFGSGDKSSERFATAYEKLRDSMSLSSEFIKEGEVNGNDSNSAKGYLQL